MEFSILSALTDMPLAAVFAFVINKLKPNKSVLTRALLATVLASILPRYGFFIALTEVKVAIFEQVLAMIRSIAVAMLVVFPVAYLVARRVPNREQIDTDVFE